MHAYCHNVDGSLDTAFDSDGKVKLDFGDGDQGFGVELDASGKVVVGGITNTLTDTEGDLLVVRLNAIGSPDTGFDSDGSRIIDLGGAKQASRWASPWTTRAGSCSAAT